jgi:hypothetical protein
MRTELGAREIVAMASQLAYRDTVRAGLLALVLEEAHASQVTLKDVLEAILAGHVGPLMRTKLDGWLAVRTVPHEAMMEAAQAILDDKRCTQADLLAIIQGYGPYPTFNQASEIRQWTARYMTMAKEHDQAVKLARALAEQATGTQEYPWL